MDGQCECCGAYGSMTMLNGMLLCDYCEHELKSHTDDDFEEEDNC